MIALAAPPTLPRAPPPARWPSACAPSATSTCAPRPMTRATRPARTREIGAALGAARACCALRGAARPTAPWTCARWWRCARGSPTSRRSPTPPSPCRGWARIRCSRAGTRRAEATAGCPRWRAGERAVRLRGHGAGGGLRPGGACARAPRADGALWRLTRREDASSRTRASPASTPCSRAPSDAGEHRGLSMFLVDADAPRALGASRSSPWPPHPLGEVRFDGTPGRPPRRARATATRWRWRRSTPSGPAWARPPAAWPRARSTRRVRWAQARRQFGRALAEFQATQMALAEMHVELDGGAPARAPRGLDAGPRRRAHRARRSGGQALRDRDGAARRRPRGADPRRAGRHARGDRRAALPRGARPAHLRGHERDPEARDRARRS